MFSLYLVFLSSLALILCFPRALRLIFNGNDDRWPTQCMSLVVMSLRILINSSTMRRTTHYAAFTAASLFRRSLSFSLFSSLFSSLPHSLSIFLLLFLCLCLSFSFSLSLLSLSSHLAPVFTENSITGVHSEKLSQLVL